MAADKSCRTACVCSTTSIIYRNKTTQLVGLQVSPARYSVYSDDALGFIDEVIRGSHVPKKYATLAAKLQNHLRVDCRYSVLPDYSYRHAERWLFGQGGDFSVLPTTAQRMAIYERESVGLAASVAEAAIEQANCSRKDITHLIISTCTGFFAPGPDIALVRSLDLKSSVKRTIIGFMGCYAGFNGMRLAHEIVQADENAVVLQVAVELCSLHFQLPETRELLLTNQLFGDGAAAAVWRRSSHGLLGVKGLHCALAQDSLDQMSWRIGNHGFVMHLASKVPKTLMKAAPSYLEDLLSQAQLTREEVSHWAIHPGGPAILNAVGESLNMSGEELFDSYDVLKQYGNMSSATIFFVLKSLLDREPLKNVVSMGFGPGLTMKRYWWKRIYCIQDL